MHADCELPHGKAHSGDEREDIGWCGDWRRTKIRPDRERCSQRYYKKYENKTYVAAEPLRPAPFYLHQLRFLKPDANLHKIQICLQFPVAAVDFGKVAPAGIAHFAEKEPRAHLCIVSGTVVRTFGDGELLAKVTERVAAEVVDLSGYFQCTLPLQFRQMQIIQPGGMLQAAAVEWCIMCYKDIELIEI